MLNWFSTSAWPSLIAALGVVLLISFVILHYWQRRRISLLFILAGFTLFIVDFALETIVPTYDSRSLPNGTLELIPRPWKAVCESIVVVSHGCIFVGLLGELIPRFAERMERYRA